MTSGRQKLTALIPCFNEEYNIEECLKSVSWADEIFIVDSFSTDRTLEIAQKYTDRIVRHEYINSTAQKNWTIPQASHEGVPIVDCDERVTPELRDEIINLLNNEGLKDGYWIFRKNYLMNKNTQAGEMTPCSGYFGRAEEDIRGKGSWGDHS
jgi:glycosyltransferase involved in cell wall biosynthesis